MAKDPAFLFYPNDFDCATKFMTHEQVGKYMRLLITQFQFGKLTLDQIEFVCGGLCDGIILAKFKKDDDGLYCNARLELERDKRKKHSKQQSKNASMRWHKNGITTAMPLENVIENENESVVNTNKGVKKFKRPTIVEVAIYIYKKSPDNSIDICNQIAAEYFNHYEANGWKVGRNSMKDWQAAARNWLSRRKDFNKSKDNDDNQKIGRYTRDGLKQAADYSNVAPNANT